MWHAQVNEDSEWWTAAVADMDTATVRGWCQNAGLSDWCWWDGVQVTTGWSRARNAFVAFGDMIERRDRAAGHRGSYGYDVGRAVGQWSRWTKRWPAN